MAERKTWRLEVLGGAWLHGPEGSRRLERKTALCLTYLALEGPTSRQRLRPLLWPESDAVRAGGCVRQMLRRLRVLAGGEVVTGGEELTLSSAVEVDALTLVADVEAGRLDAAAAREGTLLEGLHFEDCPELAGWRERASVWLTGLWREAITAECERLEREGALGKALVLAERALAREPHSEAAHRRLMRLHYLAGDTAAALGVWRRCERMLREELDALPHEETRQLARDIERARAVDVRGRVPGSAALPAALLRPPVLAGRAGAWRRLEEAAEAGRVVLVEGEAGVGKSRLARDFAAARGAYVALETQPGEARVPWAAAAGALRRLLAQRPEVGASLEPWLRVELARLLPEHAPEAAVGLPPQEGDSGRLRFLDAHAELLRRCTAGLAALVVDDAHRMDAESLMLLLHAARSSLARGRGEGLPPLLFCIQGDALPAAARAQFGPMLEAGLAVQVELGPLTPDEVEEVLLHLDLPGAAVLAPQLTGYTGGNPLFVLETVRHLVETGTLGRGWPERLAPPGRVGVLLKRQLDALSPAALQLAQLAALAHDGAWSLELGARVLGTDALALAAAATELHVARLLNAAGLVHGAACEAVRATLPPALEEVLRQRLTAVRAPGQAQSEVLPGRERVPAAPLLPARPSLRHRPGAARHQTGSHACVAPGRRRAQAWE